MARLPEHSGNVDIDRSYFEAVTVIAGKRERPMHVVWMQMYVSAGQADSRLIA